MNNSKVIHPMETKRTRWFLIATGLLVAAALIAPWASAFQPKEGETITALESRLREAMAAKFPQAKVRSVTVLDAELVEVFTGDQLLYAHKSGKWFIRGQQYSTETGANLSMQRLEVLQKVDFKSLPTKGAIEYHVPGATRTVAIFSDPRCGFCKRLEAELAKQSEFNVRVYPIAMLGPESRKVVRDISCSPQASIAWRKYLIDNIPPPASDDAKCDAKDADNLLSLSRELGVGGTPTLFFEDGTRMVGALPIDQVRQRALR
ncbi:MAG: DsbC family protein [Rhodocyclaceae bacterium]|nr:DsbC family protein [Rhodocyclaceae bacterium]MCA3025340.1 DsbC family protein [Rhodocyclaceae bacterium]MCA3028798.1 DsbC family protein [Rhodocyclaceae bacterium]MCA3032916.1 DsbC family protein [Rhodocyclaceae bacterium]MCA3037357.1 DsbC family protein [Rhodocyclaceae bacterium]